jgi:SAM-dependent methyltransferase
MKVNGINVGCGNLPCQRPGWENIDNSPAARLSRWPLLRCLAFAVGLLPAEIFEVKWPRNIRIHDVRKGLPYPDDSLSYVYSSHLLEHLHADEARAFLSECFRVLMPGGILRLAVPDLELFCRWYWELKGSGCAAGNNPLAGVAADDLVHRLHMVPGTAPRGLFNRVLRPIMGRATLHCWNYDAGSLAARFLEAGFTEVRRCSFKESAIPDIGALDVPERESESLYVEGGKPHPGGVV